MLYLPPLIFCPFATQTERMGWTNTSKLLRGCLGADVPLAYEERGVHGLAVGALGVWEADRPLEELAKGLDATNCHTLM